MATLPDINTDEVSVLSYWNAIDQGGVDSINPEDALEDGDIIEYTLYDNGWEGLYSSSNSREITVRVKNDGWFVAYIDRTERYDIDVTERAKIEGFWDIVDWEDSSSTGDILNNRFVQAIDSLQSNLDNSGDITYLSEDVGLYDYMHDSATTVTGLSAHARFDTIKSGISYTSETNRVAHVIAASGICTNDAQEVEVEQINGDSLVYSDGETDEHHYGAYDVIDAGHAPDSGTEYTVVTKSTFNDSNAVASHNQLIWWN